MPDYLVRYVAQDFYKVQNLSSTSDITYATKFFPFFFQNSRIDNF